MNDAVSTESDTNDLAELTRLNDEYIRSVRESDTEWFEAYLADDFLNSNADGSLSGRGTFINQIAQPCAVYAFAAEDVRIRLFGPMAIIHGRTTYIKSDGTAGTGRYTDVWSRHVNGWACVSAHVTRS